MARASGDRLQGRIEATLGLATALATLSPPYHRYDSQTHKVSRTSKFPGVQIRYFSLQKTSDEGLRRHGKLCE